MTATALPLRFIKVKGLTKRQDSLSTAVLRTRLWKALSSLKSSLEYSLARASRQKKPALCRVFSYSGPGFPNPTISHMCLTLGLDAGKVQMDRRPANRINLAFFYGDL